MQASPGRQFDVLLDGIGLPQPFTLSDARLALDTTRRVAVPVLEALDAARRTRRLDGSRRVVVGVG